MILPHK
ncbi:hypothetical protein YPPY53_1957, partial [Yersinia pestis PY-53]